MKSKFSMNISIFLIMIISLISSASASAGAYSTNVPYLKAVAEDISPEPAQPGQDVTVKILLTNEGGDEAKNVSLKLNASYPFFVKTESNSFKNNINLGVGSSIDNTYYLVIDANAKSGLYPLNYEIYRDGIVIKPSSTINIKIVGKPDLILKTKQLKSNVSSGDVFSFDFNVENIGTGVARDIKVIPQSSDIMMLGSNINLINEINPDKTVSFISKFIVKESLKPDTYRFPIKLEYVDEQGKSYTTSFDVGINILKRADIDFQSLKITPSFPTIVDQVHMEGMIENTGTGDAESVVVELVTPENRTYKAFIGQLKSDDDAPFYFDVKPDSIGLQKARLKISYLDDFGHHSLNTSIDKEVKRPTNDLVKVIILLLTIGLIIGYFYFKKRKSRK